MKRILAEPLLHFLLLGAAIFGVYSLLARGDGRDAAKIVVTQGQVAVMSEGFARTWHRAPDAQELAGLIRDRIQEEVYNREAVALGLDKDDLIIRRRLRQKMEFVTEERAALAEPSEAQLQDYLRSHAATFTAEPRFSFRHVYLDPQRHGTKLARAVVRQQARLNAAGSRIDATASGDPIPLARVYEGVSPREVRSLFGEKFAAALGSLPSGRWQGPIESSYGTHVVLVTERTGGGLPPLDAVRNAVRREWSHDRQREAADRSYQALLRKYEVSVEAPPATFDQPQKVAARQ